MPQKSVLVIGAGLAGLSASCELVDHGFKVTICEKRPFAGGRVYSFKDKVTGCEIDNGQHVFLNCYRELLRFFKKIDCDSHIIIQKRLNIRFVDAMSLRSRSLSEIPLIAPFHIIPSVFNLKHLSILDRLKIPAGLWRLKSESDTNLENRSFYDWLKQNKQRQKAIENFWNIIILSTCNNDVRDVGAKTASFIFKEAFYARANARIGIFKQGLSIIANNAINYLLSRNAQIIFRSQVKRLEISKNQVAKAVLNNGQELTYDYYITSVPHYVLLEILPAQWQKSPLFYKLVHLKTSPIVNIHLIFDRQVTSINFAAILNSRLQWIFNKGNCITISLSGASEYITKSNAELENIFMEELQRIFPASRFARLLTYYVVREPDATFVPSCESDDLRLPAVTELENLFLAGDWTKVGWPSTMEAAVRSGILAVRQLIKKATADSCNFFPVSSRYNRH